MTLIRTLIVRIVVVGAAALMAKNLGYERWIAPVEADCAQSARKLAKLNEQVERARQEMWEIKQHEPSTTKLRSALSSLHEHLPSDAPLVWLPPRLKATLSGFNVLEAKIQLHQTSGEPALPGFERSLWHVSLPQQPGLRNVTAALLAVAQIEQDHHFINIQELAFQAEAQDPTRITGFVNLTAFLLESKN